MKELSTVDDYRVCFSADVGQRVLANMLAEARFFEITRTPEQQAVENFMKVVLSKIGSYPIEGVSTKMRMENYVRTVLFPDKGKGFVRRLFNMKVEY